MRDEGQGSAKRVRESIEAWCRSSSITPPMRLTLARTIKAKAKNKR